MYNSPVSVYICLHEKKHEQWKRKKEQGKPGSFTGFLDWNIIFIDGSLSLALA